MRAILTFHSIDDSGSVIAYRPALFTKLLASLQRKQIPVYDLATLLNRESGDGVALTFDDGMQSVYDNALPVLRQFDVPAHLFLATNAVEKGQPWPPQADSSAQFAMLDWPHIERLHEAGIAIEGHTHTHPDMRTLSEQAMQDECGMADELIRRRLGRQPEYFAYPFGYHNASARNFARKRYKGTVTVELRRLGEADDTAALPRLDTYYLQSDWAVEHIDSLLLNAYFGFRSRLRSIKGSQCRPGCS